MFYVDCYIYHMRKSTWNLFWYTFTINIVFIYFLLNVYALSLHAIQNIYIVIFCEVWSTNISIWGYLFIKKKKKKKEFLIHASTTPKLEKWRYWIKRIRVSAICEIINFYQLKELFPPQNSELWMTWKWNIKVWNYSYIL